jgi:hypothetical protein
MMYILTLFICIILLIYLIIFIFVLFSYNYRNLTLNPNKIINHIFMVNKQIEIFITLINKILMNM